MPQGSTRSTGAGGCGSSAERVNRDMGAWGEMGVAILGGKQGGSLAPRHPTASHGDAPGVNNGDHPQTRTHSHIDPIKPTIHPIARAAEGGATRSNASTAAATST